MLQAVQLVHREAGVSVEDYWKPMEVSTMSANSNPTEIDNAVGESGGLVWNRLHSQREEVCEALAREAPVDSQLRESAAQEVVVQTANWHRELLQARLRKLDDALDRLMSGSFGSCCTCGRWIQDTKLAFDPAAAFCIDCWERKQTQH